ncbi:isochorismatase family cysteine hydrolase [Enterococcus raffinosus]|uniref:Cysteine hydrolase n=1 Tax=Enterococcus raffinosus TaxID=71452 RepID=A0AAW8T7F1_9ENTE|nr:isochorismatase family cysteine hydrolase [Enterococcus raffinosus]MDT2524339.1 cysteine hydrolase [Enterococcus raffinosus]MDT2530526.1 cysteine hydrolase [Enterococcus raffinosus]MDT2535272.1 cysteine hydrolase [Enterococcus raffinosus]MDT2545176.1 cysteine hydrolase [Enterococcus raffinosus]MDT2578737.1 cysteine hydrolase [Enterococcus raffinosus]
MLVIVDMQNRILDTDDENYVPGADKIIPKILQRLIKARKSGEMVLFTRDIPIEHKNESEERIELQIVADLAPLPEEYVFKKNYYALPPETLIDVRTLTEKRKQEKSRIEIVGVELSICVLANTLALQSALPEGDFYIDSELVAGNKLNETALQLLEQFNVEIE